MSISGLSGVSTCNTVNKLQKADRVSLAFKANKDDEFKKTDEPQKSRPQELRPIEEENQIIHDAKTHASGWTCGLTVLTQLVFPPVIGGVVSCSVSALYYSLRSSKMIAKQNKLDVNTDIEFIKKIRKKQVTTALLTAVAGAIPVVGPIGAYAYFKYVENPQKQKV